MHSSMILNLFTAALATATALKDRTAAEPDTPGVSLNRRGCFSGGDKWGANTALALSRASQACNEAFVGTDNEMWAEKGSQFFQCYNLDSNYKADFTLRQQKDGNQRLDSAGCYDGFQKEINGCEHGGETAYDVWMFT